MTDSYNYKCPVFTAHSKLRKVLFLALSVTFFCIFLYFFFVLFVCESNISRTAEGICVKFRRKTCLVPHSEVKGQGHQGQISSPLKMHCNAVAANNVNQQQTGPLCRCQ